VNLRAGISHAAAFVAGAAMVTALSADGAPRTESDRYRTLDAFAQSLSYIETQYVDPVDEKALIYAGIKGMLAQLDEHSTFLAPRRYERLRQDTEGEFGGTGIALREPDQAGGAPVVEDVIHGSPAERAGIKVGDQLVSIAGKPTAKTGRKARSWHTELRGPIGTRVELLVARAGWPQPHTITLVTARVVVPTVSTFDFEPGVGYIGVKRFQEATVADVRRALQGIEARAPGRAIRGVILDLRGNPGGLLDQGVAVADLFIEQGLIVSIAGRAGTPVERLSAHPAGTWKGFRMIAVVDQGTASAAEIVAGALKDSGRAQIFGLQTYGKGSIQTFLDLADGSGMKLTTARFQTPSGHVIEDAGITPHVQVEAFEGDDITAGDDTQVTVETEEEDESETRTDLSKTWNDDLQLRTAYQTMKGWLVSK
jgi:carboxyl-terminal processing protease